MANNEIRMSEITPASKSRGFGPFTSELSATAIFSLFVVFAALIFARM